MNANDASNKLKTPEFIAASNRLSARHGIYIWWKVGPGIFDPHNLRINFALGATRFNALIDQGDPDAQTVAAALATYRLLTA